MCIRDRSAFDGRASCTPSLAAPQSAIPAPQRQLRWSGAPGGSTSPPPPSRDCREHAPRGPHHRQKLQVLVPVEEGVRTVLGSHSVRQSRRLVRAPLPSATCGMEMSPTAPDKLTPRRLNLMSPL
eukprot:3899842-Rhodomonas_salina.5